MPCCKCEEHKWEDPQPTVYQDDAGKAYCLFHAPLENKGISVEDFNFRVKSRIHINLQNFLAGADQACLLSGTLFPGDISFRGFDQEDRLPELNLDHAQFAGEADFRSCQFIGEVTFIGAIFSKYSIFFAAKFHSQADFSNCNFNGVVEFGNAAFESYTIFSHSHFTARAHFFHVTFNKSVYFSGSQFLGDTTFRLSTFNDDLTFSKAHILGKANFEKTIFLGDVDFSTLQLDSLTYFTGCTFSKRSYFVEADFKCMVDFLQIKSEKNSVWLHRLSASTLRNICISSMETDSISFKICEEPYILYPETVEQPDHKACEELYRSLKVKAASEHDQPMTSWWHYREKLMKLEGVKLRYPKLWHIHWLGLYWLLCGFGERWVPPLKALGGMLLFCLLLLGLGGVHSGGFAIQGPALPTWENIKNLGSVCLSLLKYLLLVKDEASSFKPIYGAAEFFILLFTRLLIPIQAAFFAIALRNAYRR
ncbi:MAG: pentapeptide repeat-containing protein [Proteobacteria bacterium]|nr:pentapeptide repeat-containing protein [Pseudomonadota bacterium]MBU1595474.1 pentapeptide repeat-containing protein [Pseudomonadota bacterium]